MDEVESKHRLTVGVTVLFLLECITLERLVQFFNVYALKGGTYEAQSPLHLLLCYMSPITDFDIIIIIKPIAFSRQMCANVHQPPSSFFLVTPLRWM